MGLLFKFNRLIVDMISFQKPEKNNIYNYQQKYLYI